MASSTSAYTHPDLAGGNIEFVIDDDGFIGLDSIKGADDAHGFAIQIHKGRWFEAYAGCGKLCIRVIYICINFVAYLTASYRLS
jgi:hypothetical protein